MVDIKEKFLMNWNQKNQLNLFFKNKFLNHNLKAKSNNDYLCHTLLY